MPSIRWNKHWGADYNWTKDGDEWQGQAIYCNQPYPLWKESLVKTFIEPWLTPTSTVLEIAPGRGRWTPYLLEKAEQVHLLDLNASCIEYCKKKFGSNSKVNYHVNDGRSLAAIPDRSIDFIWSYDSFVHIELGDIDSYFSEFKRVLKPCGIAVIHHANRVHQSLALWPFIKHLPKSRELFKLISIPQNTMGGADGTRSMVSGKQIKQVISKYKLTLEKQTDSWCDQNQFNCKRFKDLISIVKNQSS